VAVEGWMQCKFAAAHPIAIRGIVLDGQLIATWSRPHEVGVGSGVLRLVISDSGRHLEGVGTGFAAESALPQEHRLRWDRVGE
jgi:hypothetical protein